MHNLKEVASEKKVGQMSEIRRYLAHRQILVDFLRHVLLLLHSANTHWVIPACRLMVERLDTMACNCLSFPRAHRNARHIGIGWVLLLQGASPEAYRKSESCPTRFFAEEGAGEELNPWFNSRWSHYSTINVCGHIDQSLIGGLLGSTLVFYC